MSPSTSRPTTVTAAFWILIVGLILDLITTIVLITTGIALAGGAVEVEVDGASFGGGVMIATGVILIVILLIELLVLRKMRAGRNWARIVITVLEVLGILSLLGGVSTLGIIAAIISVVVIVLLWVRQSNDYFRASA
ncbi:hypothetical protein ACTU6V_01610 [Microbacterium sp. A204]|uniref:hypothetical protein n=1 Tax=Microbacterium sp. A204 TaxID=3457321 RepID=UPI003FD10406